MILIGKVVKVLDNNRVEFDVPGVIIGGEADGVIKEELPYVDDEILIIKTNTHLNTTFLYKRLNRSDKFVLESNGVRIRLEKDECHIDIDENNLADTNAVRAEELIDIMSDFMNAMMASMTPQGPTCDGGTIAKLNALKSRLPSIKSKTLKIQ